MRFAILSIVLLSACTPFAVSPPLRSLPLETSQTVRAQRAAASASFGGHSHGPEIWSGNARVRYGITDDLELALDGNVMYFETLADQRPANELAGSGRIGVKHRV